MLFIFPTPVLFRHLGQLKTVVFLHWCLLIVTAKGFKLQFLVLTFANVCVRSNRQTDNCLTNWIK